MRKVIFLVGFLLFSFSLFAQSVKILEIKGEVLIKAPQETLWRKASVGMSLEEGTELKTAKKSECSLSLATEKNIFTIKEGSQVKIKQLKPSQVFLPQGRIFALVEDLSQIESFEVRTPSAIAGVRGSGESVECKNKNTTVKCFKGRINVEGIAPQGALGEDPILEEGFGIEIDEFGNLGQPFILGPRDLREWDGFEDNIQGLQQEEDKEAIDVKEERGFLDDLIEERRQDYQESTFEKEREEEEAVSGEERQGEGGITYPGGGY